MKLLQLVCRKEKRKRCLTDSLYVFKFKSCIGALFYLHIPLQIADLSFYKAGPELHLSAYRRKLRTTLEDFFIYRTLRTAEKWFISFLFVICVAAVSP